MDFWSINRVTELDPYQIGTFSTDNHHSKTAIVTPFSKLQYTSMSFGLVDATSTIQRLMDRILLGLEECSPAYIDDVLVYSESWEEHLLHLEAGYGG